MKSNKLPHLTANTVILALAIPIFMMQAFGDSINQKKLDRSLHHLERLANKTIAEDTKKQLWFNDQIVILKNLTQQIASEQSRDQQSTQLQSMVNDFNFMVENIRAALPQNSNPEGLKVTSVNVRDFGAKGDGQADDGPAIRQAITAVADVARPGEIIFPAGTYLIAKPIRIGLPVEMGLYGQQVAAKKYVPKDFGTWINCPANQKAHLLLNGLSNLKLKGEGKVELLCADPHLGAIMLRQCQNVILDNLTIDYQTLPFAQGQITSISAPETFEAEMESGFSETDLDLIRESDGKGLVRFYSANTLPESPRPAYSSVRCFTYLKSMAKVGDNTYRFTIKKGPLGSTKTLLPGMKLGLYGRMWSQAAISILSSTSCQANNLSIYASPAMAFALSSSSMITINQCRVEGKPDSDRYLSTCADGIFIDNCPFGISLTDNVIRHTGDDFLNIHSFYRPALRQQENVVYVPVHYWDKSLLKPGARIGIIKTGNTISFETRIKDVTIVKAEEHSESQFGIYRIVCEKNLPPLAVLDTVEKGQHPDLLVLLDTLCHGWVIKGNRFENGLSRMLLGGRNGLFTDNQIVESLSNADFMTIGSPGTGHYGGEGSSPRNLQISGNEFECYHPKTIIRLRSFPTPISYINILDNSIVFNGSNSLWAAKQAGPIISLSSGSDILVDGNLIDSGAFKLKNGIRLKNCQRAMISNNTFKGKLISAISCSPQTTGTIICNKNDK